MALKPAGQNRRPPVRREGLGCLVEALGRGEFGGRGGGAAVPKLSSDRGPGHGD